MSVHLLRNNHFAIFRCDKSDSDSLRSSLESHGYQVGPNREIEVLPSMIDFHVRKDGEWLGVTAADLRDVLGDAGRELAE